MKEPLVIDDRESFEVDPDSKGDSQSLPLLRQAIVDLFGEAEADDLLSAEKRKDHHLPGEHEQESHGDWADGGGSEDAEVGVLESKLRAITDHEEALIVGDNNKVVLHKKGNAMSVTFTSDEMSLMKNTDMTHNHRGGTAMSPEDIAFAARVDQRSTRVVSGNNTWTITRPETGWPKELQGDFSKAVERIESGIEKHSAAAKKKWYAVYDRSRERATGPIPDFDSHKLHANIYFDSLKKYLGSIGVRVDGKVPYDG